ncbi:ExbD/TolR family protein [Litoribrevibacter albus]|uniref:Biopolymer transporter ExbD n=1 Tax=Litoribrevibacter albus TaxID=1473156 RepID=A0AA37W6G3_9GAMM|nr:biopolymer transporter ExbD [Litoribrevibacter albus]GLQ31615.1 biopolymer transporter ExbD [Litoribrevibacter albus]
MNFRTKKREDVSVDLTPLIDVVFLLLIFFMVSTTFTKETHLEIDLPESSAEAEMSEQVELIEIVVNSSGGYSVNGNSLINNQLDTLKRAIQKESNGNTKLPMVVTADASVAHEYVVRAMDAAGQLGFTKLSITTKQAQ